MTMSVVTEEKAELKKDELSRYALAHDASHFLLIPEAVARVGSRDAMVDLFQRARATGQAITFRSGGTSLSGQASGHGILVDIRRGFSGLTIFDEGQYIEVEPGVGLRKANNRLASRGRALGPDPASEIACTVGGVIANNSSGMACGTAENSYQTLVSAEIVLPSGTVIDTSHPNAGGKLLDLEPELVISLGKIRDRIRGNDASVATIKRLFSIKNTMGYSLNAFLDYDNPIDILLRLMVGSEGTLGFISKAVFATVPLKSQTKTGLLVFRSLEEATGLLPLVIASGASVVELLDETSLSIARENTSLGGVLPEQKISGEAGLIVEYRASSEKELQDLTADLDGLLQRLKPLAPASFTSDPQVQAAIWKVRKGLFASVASRRRSGELSLLEDIAVPVDRLLTTVKMLKGLFATYKYENTVIFGHAKDGNIHFLLNQSFDSTEEVMRFENFTEDMVDLILGQGGTLKAEHGTGRMMAPYLRRQYGDELYEVMCAVKAAFDPGQLLNPGVIINEDSRAHVTNLKTVVEIEQEADSCVECGYCELVCPSKDLTLTPRQRIVVRRDITYARKTGDHALARRLEKQYQYAGLDTCAVDGMCATACPVGIDTGSLVRRLRRTHQARLREIVWSFASTHWGLVTRTIAIALTVAKKIPHSLVKAMAEGARGVFGPGDIPKWESDLPVGGRRRESGTGENSGVVFLSSCTGSMFGSSTGPGSEVAFLELCQRADIQIAIPPEANSLCCGTPWSSKGLSEGLEIMRTRVTRTIKNLPEAVQVLVTDASSCTDGYTKLIGDTADLQILDTVSFISLHLDRLTVREKLRTLVVHPTCSTERLGVTDDLMAIARHVADTVVVPKEWGCCGFAGDRGMLFPELTQSATNQMAQELVGIEADAFASSNRTCEIAMSRAVGKPYANILEILEKVTRPRT